MPKRCSSTPPRTQQWRGTREAVSCPSGWRMVYKLSAMARYTRFEKLVYMLVQYCD